MKSVPNTVCTVLLEPGKTATFADLLIFAANQPPLEGMNLVTIRKRGRVLDVAMKAKIGDELVFEDADYAVAQECIRSAHWFSAHSDISKFGEAFGV